MTKHHIAVLLERIDHLPPEAQDEIVRSITAIARQHEGVVRLSPEEREAVEEGLAQAEHGEFVPDEVVAEADERHDL